MLDLRSNGLSLEMLVSVDGGKPENNPPNEDKNQQTQQRKCHCLANFKIKIKVKLVGGECIVYCPHCSF